MMSNVAKAIGMVFLILIVAVLTPVIFGSSALGNATAFADAPGWLLTLLSLAAGIGLVLLVLPKRG
jgi:phosphate/sulfate permease